MTKILTAKSVENARAKPVRVEIPDGGCVGLYLVIQPSGAKSSAVRYRFLEKPKKLTLGPADINSQVSAEGTEAPRVVIGRPLTLKAARKLLAQSCPISAARQREAVAEMVGVEAGE